MRDAFRGMVGDVVRLYQGSERAKEGEHG
jgi:hypothetical protein